MQAARCPPVTNLDPGKAWPPVSTRLGWCWPRRGWTSAFKLQRLHGGKTEGWGRYPHPVPGYAWTRASLQAPAPPRLYDSLYPGHSRSLPVTRSIGHSVTQFFNYFSHPYVCWSLRNEQQKYE